MVHKFDLSGHGLLEDPLPPLDFQTYPDWMYRLMYPKYGRAVRHFVDEFFFEIQRQGFLDMHISPLRTADDHYLTDLWPRLRPAAKLRPRKEVALLDLIVSARKAL